MADLLSFELEGKVAKVTMDDGKANAASPDMLNALSDARARAEKEASALLLVGRPTRLSAGFDLKVLGQGGDVMRALVRQGGAFLMDLYAHPQPVVIACTGHAIALGGLYLLAADTRIGARGDFKIGLNETAIGMALPEFGRELAEARLSKRHLTASVIQAQLYDPDRAVDAGFLDEVVAPDDVVKVASERAAALAELPGKPYAATKAAYRKALVDKVMAGIDADMAGFTPS